MKQRKSAPSKDLRPVDKKKRVLCNGMITETVKYYPSLKKNLTSSDSPGYSDPPQYLIDKKIFREFLKLLKSHIEYQQLLSTHANQYSGLPLDKKTKIPIKLGAVLREEDAEITDEALEEIYSKYCETRLELSKYDIEDLYQCVNVGRRFAPLFNMRYISSPETALLWMRFIKLIYIYHRTPFHYPIGQPPKSEVYTAEVISTFAAFVKGARADSENNRDVFEVALERTKEMFPMLADALTKDQLKKLCKPSYRQKDRALHPRSLWVRLVEDELEPPLSGT